MVRVTPRGSSCWLEGVRLTVTVALASLAGVAAAPEVVPPDMGLPNSCTQ